MLCYVLYRGHQDFKKSYLKKKKKTWIDIKGKNSGIFVLITNQFLIFIPNII